jgi:hypothetical protein
LLATGLGLRQYHPHSHTKQYNIIIHHVLLLLFLLPNDFLVFVV